MSALILAGLLLVALALLVGLVWTLWIDVFGPGGINERLKYVIGENRKQATALRGAGIAVADDEAETSSGRHAATPCATSGRSHGGADHLRTPDSTHEAVTDRLRAITGTTEGAA